MCMPTTLGKVRVPGKACPVKNNDGTEKGRKGVLVCTNC